MLCVSVFSRIRRPVGESAVGVSHTHNTFLDFISFNSLTCWFTDTHLSLHNCQLLDLKFKYIKCDRFESWEPRAEGKVSVDVVRQTYINHTYTIYEVPSRVPVNRLNFKIKHFEAHFYRGSGSVLIFVGMFYRGKRLKKPKILIYDLKILFLMSPFLACNKK